MSSEDQSVDSLLHDDLEGVANSLQNPDLNARSRRLRARRRLEEEDEMRRLRDEIRDPLFDLD